MNCLTENYKIKKKQFQKQMLDLKIIKKNHINKLYVFTLDGII